MRKARTYKYLVGICVAVLFAACVIAVPSGKVARANSALRYWDGTTVAGTQILDEECPLEVEREKLTFDIAAFPEVDAGYGENGVPTVTAEYTFYNSADYAVTARLAFPFGSVPNYADREFLSSDAYGVTVNGQAVECVLRATLCKYGEFDHETDVPRLKDDYGADNLFSLDLPVYSYTYSFDGISAQYDSAYASFVMPKVPFIMSRANGYEHVTDRLGAYVENGDDITVYALGEPLSSPLDWDFHEYVTSKSESVECSVVLVESREFAFEELAFRYYDGESGISRVDWYNMILESLSYRGLGGVVRYESALNLSEYGIMRWYEYSLEVAPHSKIINAVTAPLYPSINAEYEPPVYEYRYLLSPAKVWKRFGGIDIEIRSPYYLLRSGDFDFTGGEGTYGCSLDSLPDGELEFSLCTTSEPTRRLTGLDVLARSVAIALLVGAGLIIFVPIIVLVIVLIVLKKKKKKAIKN